ncbi:hypothetical protein [Aestuariibius sp. HNIBRBA575]|uniref:hypothetical protein n=1 Tax=Aestuariibius sp. HNIBRBA575 TaxID=3233343 RepID=UPI0034A1406B
MLLSRLNPSQILRALMVCLVVLGLLAPRMSAILVHVIPGIQTVAICTGAEIIILTLDANGTPIESQEHKSEHCVLADLVIAQAQPDPHWQALARDYTRPFTIVVHDAADRDRLSHILPSRAPPAVI